MATAKNVLAVGEAMAGENEAVVGSNNTTVNKYYNWLGAPYCGGFVKYCMEKAGFTLLKGCSNPWLVSTLRKYMDAQGWNVTTPQAGDIFVEGDDDHTGYVYEYLGNGYFITLEGNYGHVYATAAQAKAGSGTTFEGIGYRKAAVKGTFKFYRPTYGGATSAGSSGASSTATAAVDTKKHFTCTPTVDIVQDTSAYAAGACKSLQVLLNAKFGAELEPDGEFGPLTKAALTAAQKKLGVDPDGSCGKDTWTALLGW